jgi:hypothetical protein
MLEIPRRKLLGMTMAVFGFFTTQSNIGYFGKLQNGFRRLVPINMDFGSSPE